jgi:hypothetical protein
LGSFGDAYDGLAKLSEEAGTPMPRNSLGRDLLLRKLDCAVIRFLHATREDEQEEPFDTVRAVFLEGGTLYEKLRIRSEEPHSALRSQPFRHQGIFPAA